MNQKIKHFEFLFCFEKNLDYKIYKFLENLVYGNICTNEINTFKSLLNEKGKTVFLENIQKIACVGNKTNESDSVTKRKNIKDCMIKNYVIRSGNDKEFLKNLNLKIVLKLIPNKNIKIKNGEIVDIIYK